MNEAHSIFLKDTFLVAWYNDVTFFNLRDWFLTNDLLVLNGFDYLYSRISWKTGLRLNDPNVNDGLIFNVLVIQMIIVRQYTVNVLEDNVTYPWYLEGLFRFSLQIENSWLSFDIYRNFLVWSINRLINQGYCDYHFFNFWYHNLFWKIFGGLFILINLRIFRLSFLV